MSPNKSKAKVFPSGLTSSDIQVPSSRFNLIFRSGFKGSRAFFFLDFIESFFSVLTLLSGF